MQRANCTVLLGGDKLNTVRKLNVTPAEIVVLRDIHGDASVTEIQPTVMDKTPHVTERGRLATIYGHHRIDRLYPGHFAKLPVSIKEIEPQQEEEEIPSNDVAAEAGAAAGAEGDDGDDDTQDGPREPDEDDQLLIDKLDSAVSKDDLRRIAVEEGVDVSNIADKMDALKAHILNTALPNVIVK